MTDKEKLEKVRAEIERRKKEVKGQIVEFGTFESDRLGLYDDVEKYDDLLSFIDSMQEECNITGIKSKEATGKLKECMDNITDESLAKARKQLEEEPASEDLEEAASRYAKEEYSRKNPATLPDRCIGCYAPIMYAFKAGANWQKQKNESKVLTEEQCRKIRDDAFELGKDAMKQKMMAKAVDTIVKVDAGGYPYVDRTIELYDYDREIPLAKKGDKVKVIVIKQE